MDAYRKHLAAAEAYGARACAHRARAERHRSLAFGGGNLWAAADATWRFQPDNHEDYVYDSPATVRDDGTYVHKDGGRISRQELDEYDDQPWEALPVHIQQGVIRKPPTIQARENVERNREYRAWLQREFDSHAKTPRT
jgi:hypothetical protein